MVSLACEEGVKYNALLVAVAVDHSFGELWGFMFVESPVAFPSFQKHSRTNDKLDLETLQSHGVHFYGL